LRIDAGANTAPLRRTLQGRRSCLVAGRNPAFPHELTECRQTSLLKTQKPYAHDRRHAKPGARHAYYQPRQKLRR
jgi:hypothetical protein